MKIKYKYVDSSIQKDTDKSIFELLDDDKQYVDGTATKSAIIDKVSDCMGRIIVPERINDYTTVSGISSCAFMLSEKIESIVIPSSVKQIERNAFNTEMLLTGYCPIIRINYEYGRKSVADSLKNDGWTCIHSGWGYFDFISEECLVLYEKDGMSFKYRKLNEHEIEIIHWISPDDIVVIPRQIECNLTIVSIGKSAFAENPRLVRIKVPETVRNIDEDAFYYLNYAQYIYGDLYDLGWTVTKDYPNDCIIQLPGNISNIQGDAFLRGTERTDRRHRFDSFINRIAIIVPRNSNTLDILLGLGWIVKAEKHEYSLLLLDENDSNLQGWLFSALFLERKSVFNDVYGRVCENLLSELS